MTQQVPSFAESFWPLMVLAEYGHRPLAWFPSETHGAGLVDSLLRRGGRCKCRRRLAECIFRDRTLWHLLLWLAALPLPGDLARIFDDDTVSAATRLSANSTLVERAVGAEIQQHAVRCHRRTQGVGGNSKGGKRHAMSSTQEQQEEGNTSYVPHVGNSTHTSAALGPESPWG